MKPTQEQIDEWKALPWWRVELNRRKDRTEVNLIRKGWDPPWSDEPFAEFGCTYVFTPEQAEQVRDGLTVALDELENPTGRNPETTQEK